MDYKVETWIGGTVGEEGTFVPGMPVGEEQPVAAACCCCCCPCCCSSSSE